MSDLSDRPLHWDPFNQEYYPNPYPIYKRMRAEAPLYYNSEHDFYAVSRYDDVQRVFSDRDTFSSARGDVFEHIKSNAPIPKGMFIAEDPPLHTVHRGVVTRVFTPKRMQALDKAIRAFCAQALDPLVPGGEFDFIEDFGQEMPMRVIGMLLGIPEQDLQLVRAKVDETHYVEPGKPKNMEGVNFLDENYDEYITWREQNPSDDLMTELLNVEFEDENGVVRKLDRPEVLMFVTMIAAAGNETTNRHIGWIGKVLADHPDQRRQIHENRALIPQTIEEILRYEPPGPCVSRYVARDTEFHGAKVPEGSIMIAIAASGNRDDRKFENGEAFNIHRERLPHFSFGYGFHNCLGNALARVEGRIALDEILNRFPEWNVDNEKAFLAPSSTTRGYKSLPAYTPYAKRGARAAAKSSAKKDASPAAAPDGAEAWAISMKTPGGPQDLTAYLVRENAKLTGRIDSKMGAIEIKDGKIDGDTLSWTMHVKKPMPVKLSFNVKVAGDAMTGKAKLGMFGEAEVTGQLQA
jgi:cytochrome P450